MARRAIVDAGWVALGLGLAFSAVAVALRGPGFDLDIYLRAARAIVAGRSPYLAPGSPACDPLGCFVYAPPAALLFVPLLVLPRVAALTLVVVALAAVAAVFVAALVGPLPRAARPWAATAAVLFFPLVLEVSVANLTLLTAALALAAWSRRDDARRCGLLLAAAIGLKLLVAPLVVFYLAAGRWRAVAWAAAVLAVGAVATAPLVGAYWGDAVGAAAHRIAVGGGGSIRPPALAAGLGLWATVLLAIVAEIATGVAVRRASGLANELHAVGLAAVPLVAASLDYTYLVLVMPLLVATTAAFASSPLLLALPLGSWAAMEVRGEMWLCFGGYVVAVASGVSIYVRGLSGDDRGRSHRRGSSVPS
ncbi:MAG: DUF2029 domain-containing protein [Chloroflexota bacterium]|nr:DUF2029 domain-containing protein [Chloroflexota bacterium]